jgi:hypothetical protein
MTKSQKKKIWKVGDTCYGGGSLFKITKVTIDGKIKSSKPIKSFKEK